MKLFKLDRRHNGYGSFSHAVDFTKWKDRHFGAMSAGKFEPKLVIAEFVTCRNWCWENYGPGCEVWAASSLDEMPEWAWINDVHSRKIYFKNETVAGMFSLMWCK